MLDKVFFAAIFTQGLFIPIILIYMFRTRLKAIKTKRVNFKYYITYESEKYDIPRDLQQMENHFNNLFQMPIFFMIVCLTYLHFEAVDTVACLLAWLFVVSRLAHSYVHIGSNNIVARYKSYGLGCISVLIMWLYLAGKICLV